MRRRELAALAATALILMGDVAEVSAQEDELAPPVGVEQRARVAMDAETGRPFQVAFPRHDRLVAGITARGGDGLGVAPGVELGWRVASFLPFSREEIWWRLRHQILELKLHPIGEGLGGAVLGAMLVRGEYLRHDRSSFVVVPTGEGSEVRLPAPFDVALGLVVGRLELETGTGGTPRLAWARVVEVDVLMDFVRDPSYRHRLAIGASGRYDIARVESGGWHHELAPLSGAAALWSWESATGLFSARLEARGGARFAMGSGADGGWGWGWRAQGELEWVVAAINDQPLSLPLRVAYHRLGPAGARAQGLEIEAGLRLSFLTGGGGAGGATPRSKLSMQEEVP